MTTLATAELPSDDEDGDFVLSEKAMAKLQEDADLSSSSSSDSDEEGGSSKRKRKKRKLAPAQADERITEPVISKEAIDDLWASFNETPQEQSSSSSAKLVTIKQTYEFAGTVAEREVQVPADSAEARQYLDKTGQPNLSKQANTQSVPVKDGGDSTALDSMLAVKTSSEQPPVIPPSDLPETSSASVTAPLPSSSTPLGRPKVSSNAPKRKKSGLAALSAKLAAQNSNTKPTKLNTLEKSKMDWQSYVTKEKLEDDLETSRKSKNGYLDKQDFLARSEQHKEEEYDRLKSAAAGRRRAPKS